MYRDNRSGRNVQESAGKGVIVVRTCDENVKWIKGDADECS